MAEPTVLFLEGVSDEVKLKEIVCNAFHRLSYRVQAPKNSRTITGKLQDQMRGMLKFSYEYEITARVAAADGGGNISLNITERYSGQRTAQAETKLNEYMQVLDEEATDYLAIQEKKPQPETFGTARWATDSEVIEAGYVVRKPESERLLLAPWKDETFLALPPPLTHRHALVCGPTGAGKSTGFFIPNICARFESSFIVTEATAGDEPPQLYAETAGWRHFQDSEIFYFNPDHLDSTRINPMDKVIFAAESEVPAAAEELCDLIIINTSPPKSQRSDPIWDKSEKWVLWIMIMHVVATGDIDQCHFGAIRQMLRKSEKQLVEILSNSPNPEVAEEFRAFVRHSSENFRHGVFAGLLSRLNPWLTDKIVTLTRVTDFDVSELKDKLFTFYLSVPSRKRFLKPVAALIFNYLLDLALEGGKGNFKYPLSLMLDEFTNFGAIPGIHDVLSIIRRREVGIMLGCQSLSQIELLYDESIMKAILEQLNTTVMFAPRDRDTAMMMSRELGMQTRIREEVTISGDKMEREYGLPLMSAQELRAMASNEVLIHVSGVPPIKTRRFDFTSYPAPRGYEPPERTTHEPNSSRVSVQQQKVEEQFESKPAPKISEEERSFFQDKPDPPRRSSNKPKEDDIAEEPNTGWQEDDWNIP